MPQINTETDKWLEALYNQITGGAPLTTMPQILTSTDQWLKEIFVALGGVVPPPYVNPILSDGSIPFQDGVTQNWINTPAQQQSSVNGAAITVQRLDDAEYSLLNARALTINDPDNSKQSAVLAARIVSSDTSSGANTEVAPASISLGTALGATTTIYATSIETRYNDGTNIMASNRLTNEFTAIYPDRVRQNNATLGDNYHAIGNLVPMSGNLKIDKDLYIDAIVNGVRVKIALATT